MCPFFFNDTATTGIYTLSLHDALPIWYCVRGVTSRPVTRTCRRPETAVHHATDTSPATPLSTVARDRRERGRSEEHTSELQSLRHLVCRLLLEKKKKNNRRPLCTHNSP